MISPSILSALHVISVVAWFAGLFYLGRLFVYHREAQDKGEPDKSILSAQFEIMERRLYYGIMVPAMISTLVFGIWLMVSIKAYQFGWMHFKLLFVFLLIGYHHMLGGMRKRMAKGAFKYSSFKLRVLNEVPTVLLIIIVFTIYLKDMFSGLWGALIMVVVSTLVMLLLKKRKKDKVKPS